VKKTKRALVWSGIMLAVSVITLTTMTYAWFLRDAQEGATLEFVRSGTSGSQQSIPIRANAATLSTVTVVGSRQSIRQAVVYGDPVALETKSTWEGARLRETGENGVEYSRVYFKTTITNSTSSGYRVSLYLASVTGVGSIGIYGDYDQVLYNQLPDPRPAPEVVSKLGKDWNTWSTTTYNVPVVRNIDVPAGGTREIEWFLETQNFNGVSFGELLCMNN